MTTLKFVWICLTCFLLSAQGGRLHPQWCALISGLCKRFENNPGEVSLIYIHSEYSVEEPFLHLLPPVLIWAPIEQFKISLVCPKCESSSQLYGHDWMNGRTDRSDPRKVHGRDGPVILVGGVYKCMKMGHETVSYHPGILRQFKTPLLIPFRLWSRTGFTYELLGDIEAMILSGISISKIEASLVMSAIGQYSNRKNRYDYLKGSLVSEFPSYEEWCSFLPTISPSIKTCNLWLFSCTILGTISRNGHHRGYSRIFFIRARRLEPELAKVLKLAN